MLHFCQNAVSSLGTHATLAPWRTAEPVSVSAAGELGEAFEIAPFGDLRRPGREVVALDRGGELGRRAEEPARLGGGESGKARRLEVGGGTVRGLGQRAELRR